MVVNGFIFIDRLILCLGVSICNAMLTGDLVRITTTNGGETVARLLHDYRPTYAVTLEPLHGRGWFVVLASRLKSIEPAEIEG